MLIGFAKGSFEKAEKLIPKTDNLQIAELFPWGYATGSTTRISFLNQLKFGQVLVPNEFWREKGYGPGFVDEEGQVFLVRLT